MNRIYILLLLLLILATITSCENNTPPKENQITSDSSTTAISTLSNVIDTALPIVDSPSTSELNIPKKTPIPPNPSHSDHKPSSENNNNDNDNISSSTTGDYAWLSNYNSSNSLQKQIPVPTGYKRIPAKKGAFATWLRGLPLHPNGTKVLLCNGEEKPYQAGANRVINIDVGKRDLQQCADAVMRLKAEYHYSNKSYSDIHFNYTSGHNIRFTDWSKGKKPKLKNGKVQFSSPSGSTNTSYKNFKKYLTNVYCYAGTASLAKELKPKAISDIEPGDVFIWGGFPGHAVLVVDVAEHEQTGKKIFLIAQSYMPAQSIHILNNFNNSDLSPWYSEDFGNQLDTPEWTFSRDALKKW